MTCIFSDIFSKNKTLEYIGGLKKMKMSNQTKKIITRIFIVAVIVGLSVSTITLAFRARKYEYALSAKEQNAIVHLAEYVDSIETELHKGIYANSAPMVSEVAINLTRDSSCAKSALSQITASDSFLEYTYKFLSQVGDYANSINSSVQNGKEITAEQRNNLNKLLDYASELTDNIAKLVEDYESGDTDKLRTEAISTGLSDTEQSFSDYPSLIYDGPFSDHVGTEDAEMLKGLDEISEDEARNKVSELTGIEKSELLLGSDETSTFDCYTYSTGSTSISITKKGGFLCTILTSNRVGETKIGYDEAIEKGKEYLKKAGYDNMVETYYCEDDGVCIINFAYSIGDTICYTDLIKVGVALDDGRILTLDARGYIMNHQSRELPQFSIDEETAKQKLAENLKIKNMKIALIPSDSDKEYLCYEFLCTGAREEDILVYIDGQTGVERDILLLLYTDGGTLTK